MKWTNMALQLYAQDYDDRLPGRRWMDEANAYAKNWETFACPTVHLEDHRAYGFAFERTLAGKVTKGITKPEVQQLVYESSLLYKNTMAPVRDGLAKPGRHNRGNNVGFLDGHCKRISDGDAGKLWL